MCIFANQLRYVLHQHKKDLGSLYSVPVPYGAPGRPYVSVHPEKIERMKRGAEGDCSKSATINPSELEAVQKKFGFTAEEIRRLRSALAGEFVFRYLLDRTGESERALRAGEYVFHLLFDADESTFGDLRTLALDDIRAAGDLPEEESDFEQKIQEDLEPTIELYGEALLCLDAARMARNPLIQQGYLAMATSLLTNAEELIAYPSAIVQGSPQQVAWQQLIADALEEVNRF
ncbi:MAG: hypothetical protein ACJ8DI_32855 [Ktedonobacteraceae bacterium]